MERIPPGYFWRGYLARPRILGDDPFPTASKPIRPLETIIHFRAGLTRANEGGELFAESTRDAGYLRKMEPCADSARRNLMKLAVPF
jgi:hypothetical protein